MTAKTRFILQVLHATFWLIFIGLCIKTGAILVSFLVSLLNPEGANNLYPGLDLHDLYQYGRIPYILMVTCLVSLTGLKALVAWLSLRIFLIFDLNRPFKPEISVLTSKISYFALVTGILAVAGQLGSKVLNDKGVLIVLDWGGSEILFFAGLIYLVSRVFAIGSELQIENDLTI